MPRPAAAPAPLSRRTRRLRLARFAVLALLALGFASDAALAGSYVYALGHPGCHDPRPLVGFPNPSPVTLTTPDGLQLPAWYYPPRNGRVVLALGGPGGALGDNLPPLGFLLTAGYGALQVGSRVCASPPAAVTIGANELLDAQAALDYLGGRPEVQTTAAFGFSMGGVTAIRAAARRPEIAALVAEGGYFNMGRDFTGEGEGGGPLERLFLYSVAGMFYVQHGVNPFRISPVDDLPLISPRPVLLIYGSQELQIGRGELQYAAAGPPKELWVVPGGDHGTNYAVAGPEYERRVLEFFNRWLQTGAGG
ncbi:MAG: alpha/beta hydrolase family protein [Chloroflexota bacterium]